MIEAEPKGISRIKLSLEVVKVNPDGSEGESRMAEDINSWVKQWPDIIGMMFETGASLGGSTGGVLDTGSVSRTIEEADGAVATVGPRANALINDNSFGIQVGTGDTAVAADDDSLATLIVEGTSSGQLTHQAVTFSLKTAISGGYRFSISRQVDNASGGTITVEEIGLVVEQRISGPGIGDFLVLRDLVTQIILDTESFIFRYHMDWIS